MNQVLEALANDCKIESPARMEGKRMVALLAPKPGGPGEKPAAGQQAKPKGDQPKPAAPAPSQGAQPPAPKPQGQGQSQPQAPAGAPKPQPPKA
jgi:translation initiation factor IF-3